MNNVDILIPVQYGHEQDPQLLYTIKGIKKHLKNYGQILCVTGADREGFMWKEYNIFTKLKEGSVGLSDPFLYFNDDWFLLTDYDANEFPTYYDGTVAQRFQTARGTYARTVANTLRCVRGNHRFYDVHCPMLVHKSRIPVGMNWDGLPYGYCIKTLMAHDKTGEQCADLKIREPKTLEELTRLMRGRKWFSTADEAVNDDLILLLKKLYDGTEA